MVQVLVQDIGNKVLFKRKGRHNLNSKNKNKNERFFFTKRLKFLVPLGNIHNEFSNDVANSFNTEFPLKSLF